MKKIKTRTGCIMTKKMKTQKKTNKEALAAARRHFNYDTYIEQWGQKWRKELTPKLMEIISDILSQEISNSKQI